MAEAACAVADNQTLGSIHNRNLPVALDASTLPVALDEYYLAAAAAAAALTLLVVGGFAAGSSPLAG